MIITLGDIIEQIRDILELTDDDQRYALEELLLELEVLQGLKEGIEECDV
jgi:hypothetical protein